MSYLGRGIDQIDNISTLDNLSFNGSSTTFNLTQNSVAFTPVSADALQIQIDGVIQSGNYTVSGSTVTFDFTPSGSSVCNGIKHFGVGVLTSVSDGAVTTAKLGADSVNATKIADDSISDEHLDITAITGQTAITSLADTDKFLVSDASDSGNLKYVEKQYLPSGTWVQTGRVNNSSVGSTTINLEGCFSNTYDVYMMVMRDFRPSVDGSRMRMIILTGTNTLVSGSHYRIAHSIDYASGTGTGGVKTERHTGSDEFHFFDSIADGEAHGGGSATIFITVDKTNTSGNTFKFHGTCSFADSDDRQNTGKMGGFYKETTNDENPTGLQFKSDNNITSIDVTVYGLVQS